MLNYVIFLTASNYRLYLDSAIMCTVNTIYYDYKKTYRNRYIVISKTTLKHQIQQQLRWTEQMDVGCVMKWVKCV